MLLNNKKQSAIDTCHQMNESKNNYAKWNKPGKKSISCIFTFYKTIENVNYHDIKQIRNC